MAEISYYSQRPKFYPSTHRLEDIEAMPDDARAALWDSVRAKVRYEAGNATAARWLGLKKDAEMENDRPDAVIIAGAIAILCIYGWLHARREEGAYEFQEEPFLRAVKRVKDLATQRRRLRPSE